jgi:HEPN domain-containing protein
MRSENTDANAKMSSCGPDHIMLLEYAGQRLEFARKGMKEGFLMQSVMLCQRCAELSLRAFLTERGAPFKMTHEIGTLFNEGLLVEPAFARFQTGCDRLRTYALPVRGAPPAKADLRTTVADPKECDEAIAFAQSMFAFVMENTRVRR